jgi:hypothetical protein
VISEPVQLRLHTPVRPQQKNGERNLWEMVCDLRDGELHIPYHQRELVMDADEVLRFKQQVALPELFRRGEYSAAWE